MDKGLLEGFLAQGLSLEAIGRRVERHPSTVKYWLTMHGLKPAHSERRIEQHPPERAQLAALVEEGLTIREMAERIGRSRPTVSYWLTRYGLESRRASRRREIAAVRSGETAVMECSTHGMTEFVVEASGRVRCLKCRAEAVVRRRRKVKGILVQEAGGRCRLCGYSRCVGALHFHHLDPAKKAFGLSHGGFARAIDILREEASKCVLLCSNCHAEVESGMSEVAV